MTHKLLALSLVFLLLGLAATTVAAATVADEFIALGQEYEHTSLLDLTEAVPAELMLRTREMKLTNRLLESPADLDELAQKAAALEGGLLSRLLHRLQFEVSLNQQTRYASAVSAFRQAWLGGRDDRLKKKIAYIHGCEVNMLDGEWHTTPDGRRFWVSNEYPDIVLSAAEYRKYLSTAVVVND
jgi:hypothetical protein